MALEMAILAPLIIVMLLVVVAFGRVTHGRAMVDQAAAAAARSASLAATPGQASTIAGRDARETLAGAGLSCTGARVSLDTSAFRPGGQVTADVTCTVDLSSLALAGVPGRLTLTASSTAPLESYRDFAGAGAAP
ncbi:TadE/TadG family type IV pilus assembly protein [Kineosporia sp. R_H_3]|uniref:TadE/TadG family type IV pilus assembly protein n=1 Tax=Kineosporia sp. R_H_3 TaxID=1961848 RepID=UPI000B4BED4D|nr:TadE/TadG family type IV pilus assembly protein [Kineosporia sp. R_H_3]